MADRLAMLRHLAGQAARAGWFYGLHELTGRLVKSQKEKPAPPPRPISGYPSRNALMRDLLDLFLSDARNVRDGVYPAMTEEGDPLRQIALAREMIADVPKAHKRRVEGDAKEVQREPDAEGLPEYFLQNFHYQTGGYLTEESARLYDIQVETLFLGSAGAMRRQALPAIANHIRGRDQRNLSLLDVACGTGRFLDQVKQAFPVMPVTGIDLSQAYIEEARRHLRDRRGVTLMQANAESLPLPDASQDIVTSIFLYHELPQEVRQRVSAEIARVLKPGGLFAYIDSLQMGDKPSYDGMLETFPGRFHEPYYANYLRDDLEAQFSLLDLARVETRPIYLSKLMVRRRL